MKRFLGVLGVIGVIGAVATPPAAQADNGKGFYVRLEPGAIIPIPTGYEISGAATSGGVTYSAAVSGQWEYTPGWSINAIGGYHLTPFIALEGEVGYRRFGYDSVSADAAVTLTAGGTTVNVTASDTLDVDGDIRSYDAALNAIITPMGMKARFPPYIGGGLGFTSWNAEIETVTYKGRQLAVNSETSQTDLAATAMIGLDYRPNDKWAVGARYRYYWADTGTAVVDDLQAHGITATLTYNF